MTSLSCWMNETTVMSCSISETPSSDGYLDLAYAIAVAVGPRLDDDDVGTLAYTTNMTALAEAWDMNPSELDASFTYAETEINEPI